LFLWLRAHYKRADIIASAWRFLLSSVLVSSIAVQFVEGSVAVRSFLLNSRWLFKN